MSLQAKDLMIGDWVYIKDHPIKSQPQKVKPEHLVRSLVEFESIPLTKEILEKNGWIYEDSLWLHDDAIILQKGFDSTNLFFWFVAGSPFLPINYVHELQHALKLYKSDKKIEL